MSKNGFDILSNTPITPPQDNTMTINLYRPDEIKAYLDQFVIGQDEAKRTLSVAIYNHYKKIAHNYNKKNKNGVKLDKSNVLICGPTGSGKTYMIQKIAELLGAVCVIQDATVCTEAGFVGSDVEECLVGLLRACDYNINKAQMGIVVLDEVDKIAKKEAGPNITRDVGGEGVQQAFLKMLEGATVSVPPAGGRKHPEQSLIYIDTTNILFIGLGAFVGLETIIKKRLGANAIGFETEQTYKKHEEDEYIKYVSVPDFRHYGLIPEFVSRFPVVTYSERLSVDALTKVLFEPKNSIVKQYEALLGMDNIKLVITDEAAKEIAETAYNFNTGARGLRTVMEKVMSDVMFNAPKLASEGEHTITITKEMVAEKFNKKEV